MGMGALPPLGSKTSRQPTAMCHLSSINRRCLLPCPPSFNSTSPIVANLPNQAPARTVLGVPCHCWRLIGLVLMFAHLKVVHGHTKKLAVQRRESYFLLYHVAKRANTGMLIIRVRTSVITTGVLVSTLIW